MNYAELYYQQVKPKCTYLLNVQKTDLPSKNSSHYLNTAFEIPTKRIPNYFTIFESPECNNDDPSPESKQFASYNKMAGIMGIVPATHNTWIHKHTLRKDTLSHTDLMVGVTLRVAQAMEEIYIQRGAHWSRLVEKQIPPTLNCRAAKIWTKGRKRKR